MLPPLDRALVLDTEFMTPRPGQDREPLAHGVFDEGASDRK